uniref:hypothetical protein n=1 Tax=Wolbachia endosymbiont of Atemnus politus TaxID=2682840 RepID=UPI002105845C|nr:hypothetical protein [Wolbachia endosymbiont of Atemnus politus]
MFGSNAPIDKTDWTPLKGKHVIIWPDNDDSGKKYAEKLQKSFQSLEELLRLRQQIKAEQKVAGGLPKRRIVISTNKVVV